MPPLTEQIPLDRIDVGDRLRQVNEDKAFKYSLSIKERGLHQAIIVRPSGHHRFDLVAGAHRLRAHELLERETIACTIRDLNDDEAELVEIEENLMRSELTAAERILSVGLWSAAFLEANPQYRRGGDRGNQHVGGKVQSSDFARFDEVMKSRTGRSRSSNFDDMAAFEALGSEVLKALAGSEIADNAGQLKALAKLAPEQRLNAAYDLANGHHRSVKDYRIAIGDIEQVPADPESEWVAKYVALWQAAKPAWRKRIMRMHEAGEL